jgi:DNA repair protein RecO (recombination protein O)
MGERVERQPSFVLHERAYRETSALIELLTREHGRICVIARGLRAVKPRFPRGLLQSMQLLDCSFVIAGELGQLTAAEAVGIPMKFDGVRLQAVLYLNELLVRLLARQDPHPGLFDAYRELLAALPLENARLSFALRRFEALLLAELGYGIDFAFEASSQTPIGSSDWYRVIPEHGAVRVASATPDAIAGSALLAMQQSQLPAAADLRALRQLMRAMLLHHLGGRELQAWRVLKSPLKPAALE